MSEISIKLAAGTNVGLVRKNNEDNFVVNRDLCQSEWIIPQSIEPISLGRYGSILVVADGMGGTNAGEVASAIAIETVQNAFTPENLGDIVTQEGIVTSEEAVEEFLGRTVKTADLNIVNASKDLGANDWQTFTKIIFPLSLNGVRSGVQSVFIPSLSLFMLTRLIGGNRVITLGTAIEQHFLTTQNWGMGATIGVVLIVTMIAIMWLTKERRQ